MTLHDPEITPQQNTEQTPHSTPCPPYLFEEHRDAPFFSGWYRFTAPPPPDVPASAEARHHFRSTRTTSRTLLLLVFLVVVALPLSFLSGPPPLPFFFFAFALLALAISLNRVGQPLLASILVVALCEIGLLGGILLAPEATPVATFDLLALPLLLTASLLSRRWVFGVALLNGLFTVVALVGGLHATGTLVIQPLLLQGVVMMAALMWMRDLTRARARADRAEVIARLEHDLATHGQLVATQKQQMEEGLQQVIETHLRVAGGDLTARIPFEQTHVLWQLAGLLNTLLAHHQHARQAEEELQRTRTAMDEVVRDLRNARQYQHALTTAQTRTILDALMQELQSPAPPAGAEHLSQGKGFMVEPTQNKVR